MEKIKQQVIQINDGEIDLASIFRILLRQKKSVFLLTLTATLSAIFYSITSTPTWLGSFDILVKKEVQSNSQNFASSLASITGDESLLDNKNETERLILLSPSVLMPVYEFVNNHYKENDLETFTSFKSWRDKELDVDFESKTNILSIKHKNKDKELILKTLNLISEKYKDYSKRDKEKLITKTINYLEAQKKIMEAKSNESRKKYNEFAIENGLGNIDGFISVRQENKNSILNNNSLSNFLNSNEGIANEILNERGISTVSDSTDAGTRFKNQFAQLEIYESRYVDLSSKLKPNSETLKNLKLKIDNLKSSLKRPNEILINYRTLYNEAIRNESLLVEIENNLELMKLEKVKTPNAWEMISVPNIDKKPIFPKKKNITLIGFFIGLFLSSFYAILREKKSGIVYEFSELQKKINSNYLENLFQFNKELNYKIIEKILDLNTKNMKEINSKIGLFSFTKTNNDVLNLDKNSSNYNIVKNPEIEDFKDFDKIILIIQSGQIKSKEIILLNKYISIFSEKVIGWTFIDTNLKI